MSQTRFLSPRSDDSNPARVRLGRPTAVVAVVIALTSILTMSTTNAWTPHSTNVNASIFGGTGTDLPTSIETDSAGNMYVTGKFSGTIDLDPGTGTENRTSNGGYDAFVVKLDASGDFVWGRTFGGTSGGIDDTAEDVAVDSSGNVFVTGTFNGTANFGGGNVTASGSDVYVMKIDSAGVFVWVKTFGGTNTDIAYSIAVSWTGNIHITGTFRNTIDFDPGNAGGDLTAGSSFDGFVAKLDGNGNYVWAMRFGDPTSSNSYDDIGRSIAVDGAGWVYVVGNFRGTVDFDPANAGGNFTSQNMGNPFLLQLATNGNYIRAKSFDSNNGVGRSVAVNSGSVYVGLDFQGFVQLSGEIPQSSNSTGAWLVKFDTSGVYQWHHPFAGVNDARVFSIRTSPVNSDVFVGGMWNGAVSFDRASSSQNKTSSGNDAYLLRLTSTGTFGWVATWGNSFNDEVMAITVDSAGLPYAAGWFLGWMDFDVSFGISNLRSNSDSTDVFVTRLDSGGRSVPTTSTTTTTTTSTTTTTTIAPTTTTTVASGTTTSLASSGSGGSTTSTLAATSGAATTVPRTVSTDSRATTTTIATARPIAAGGATNTTVESTTTSAPSVTTTTTAAGATPPPDDDTVGPGGTGITRDGSPTDVEVVEENGTLVATMDGSTFTYSATDTDGNAKSVSKTGFTLAPGDSVSIAVAGLGDTSSAIAWLHPEGREVGNAALSGGAGTVTVTFDDDVEPGDKRLVLVATDRMGRELNVTQGLRITADGSSGPSWSMIFLVIVGLGVAAGFLIPAARRRRDEEEPTATK